MKELQEILSKISKFAPGEKAILATVVDVVGSGYRRPGARMLIDKNGFSIGTVSGGCLEADVLERAKKVLETDEPIVITYDTTADENSVFGLSMGCRGIVRVLLEAVTQESLIFSVLRNALEKPQKQIIATLISTEDNTPIGTRIFYNQRCEFDDRNLPDNFKMLSLDDDCSALFDAKENSFNKTYQTESGKREFFIEKINPPLSLLLFGAGFDALPLIRLAKELGWRVTTIDHRAAYNNAERIAAAEIIVSSSTATFCAVSYIQNAFTSARWVRKSERKSCWKKSAKHLPMNNLDDFTRPSVWTSARTRPKKSRSPSSPKSARFCQADAAAFCANAKARFIMLNLQRDK